MCEEEAEELNDDLKSHYEVIILGTGLVQSILSCVFSKHSIKVLHLDKNSFYGETSYSSHSLSGYISYFKGLELQETEINEKFLTKIQLNSSEELLVSVVKDELTSQKSKLVQNGRYHIQSCHPACFDYATMECSDSKGMIENGISAITHPVFLNYVKHKNLTRARLWGKDREFNIDSISRTIFATGDIVDMLITSGVSNYLEFKCFEGLFFWVQQDYKLWKIPCSRGDVFNTAMLSILEKRELMKFHSFVADWGRSYLSGKDIISLNENELAVGRSLYRPQNKEKSIKGYDVYSFEDKSIEEFLNSCKISPKLQQVILYALCCYHTTPYNGNSIKSYNTLNALRDMFLHIDSIGRFGETAFLSTIYGTSEIVQAFCRMSAVWGGTFILNRGVQSVNLDSNNAIKINESDNISLKKTKIHNILDSEGRITSCDNFICSANYWPNLPTLDVVKVSCVSIFIGNVLPLSSSIAIIPPYASLKDTNGEIVPLNNPYVIHIIQSSSSSHTSPEGTSIIHINTQIAMDDILSNAGDNWREKAKKILPRSNEIINKVMLTLNDGEKCYEEVSRVITISPVYDNDKIRSSFTLPPNLELVYDSSDISISFQPAFDEAKRIFRNLYPNLDFSLKTLDEKKGVDSIDREEDQDDESMYLQFALNSIKKS